MQTLVNTTLDALNTSADLARADFCAGYHPTSSRILGVPTPALRAGARRLARQVADWPADRVVALARALLDTGVHEGRQVAYELLGAHRAAARGLDRAALEALGTGMDNWVSVDTFATLLAGRALREGRIDLDDLLAWARSPDRWWRRAALVSTTGWNHKSRGGRGETAGTLRVCAALVADRDEMVVKALSWALRELAPWDPDAVRGFLLEHTDVVAARARREVATKLETGTKRGTARPSAPR